MDLDPRVRYRYNDVGYASWVYTRLYAVKSPYAVCPICLILSAGTPCVHCRRCHRWTHSSCCNPGLFCFVCVEEVTDGP